MKNTECLNTTNFCVFKCSNISNATTVFNSRRCSKSMFKIIHFLKITEEKKKNLANTLNNCCCQMQQKKCLKLRRNIDKFE